MTLDAAPATMPSLRKSDPHWSEWLSWQANIDMAVHVIEGAGGWNIKRTRSLATVGLTHRHVAPTAVLNRARWMSQNVTAS